MHATRWSSPSSLTFYFGDPELKTLVLERRFFAKTALPNGTHKTTHRNRLDDLNNFLLPHLKSLDSRPLTIMDVGASSGITTAEWSSSLRAHGVSHKMIASDTTYDALLTSWGKHVALLSTQDNKVDPLLFEMWSLSVPPYSNRKLARLVRPLLVPCLRFMGRVSRKYASPSPMTPPRPWRWIQRPVRLVSPSLLQHPEIDLVEDDILTSGRFLEELDVIRVANVLNRGYFDDITLKRMVCNLRDRLRDNGLLAVCRTTDAGTNRYTVFRRCGNQLVPSCEGGGGVEIAGLVSEAASSDLG